MSSGGLRNTNSSPRTVVCSIDFYYPDGVTARQIRVVLNFEAPLSDSMSCTLYTRAVGTGQLLDSVTQVFTPGSNGIDKEIGSGNNWTSSGVAHHKVNHYVQCKLPANARIFSTRTFI